jgi:hypothetical protein
MELEPWKPRSATKAGQSSRVVADVKATEMIHRPTKIRRFTVEKLERAVAIAEGGF